MTPSIAVRARAGFAALLVVVCGTYTELRIQRNEVLADVTALAGLVALDGPVYVTDDPQLDTCAVLDVLGPLSPPGHPSRSAATGLRAGPVTAIGPRGPGYSMTTPFTSDRPGIR